MAGPNHNDIYERLGNFGGRMTALENLVTEGFERVEASISKMGETIGVVTADHEKRLREVEINQGAAKGGIKTLLWVGGAMGTVIGIAISLAQWVLG